MFPYEVCEATIIILHHDDRFYIKAEIEDFFNKSFVLDKHLNFERMLQNEIITHVKLQILAINSNGISLSVNKVYNNIINTNHTNVLIENGVKYKITMLLT